MVFLFLIFLCQYFLQYSNDLYTRSNRIFAFSLTRVFRFFQIHFHLELNDKNILTFAMMNTDKIVATRSGHTDSFCNFFKHYLSCSLIARNNTINTILKSLCQVSYVYNQNNSYVVTKIIRK